MTSRFSVTPGIRWEGIESSLKGLINNASFPVAYTGKRNFPLLGAGLQYQVSKGTQLYGNFSQAYRPYIYASITPADAVLMPFVLMYAGMIVEYPSAGAKLSDETSPQQVAFFKQNEKALKATAWLYPKN